MSFYLAEYDVDYTADHHQSVEDVPGVPDITLNMAAYTASGRRGEGCGQEERSRGVRSTEGRWWGITGRGVTTTQREKWRETESGFFRCICNCWNVDVLPHAPSRGRQKPCSVAYFLLLAITQTNYSTVQYRRGDSLWVWRQWAWGSSPQWKPQWKPCSGCPWHSWTSETDRGAGKDRFQLMRFQGICSWHKIVQV